MLGIGLTRTRLSTRLGLSIGDVVATLLNTRDFTNLRPIDILGLAQFVQALDAQLTEKGRPYTGDPVEVEVTGRLLSVVTAELQAIVDALPVVDPEPDPTAEVIWDPAQVVWDPAQVVWGGSTVAPAVQSFAFGPASGQPGEGGTVEPVQSFSFGAASTQPSEETPVAVQNFSFGAAGEQPAESATPVQNFAFGAATTTPSE